MPADRGRDTDNNIDNEHRGDQEQQQADPAGEQLRGTPDGEAVRGDSPVHDGPVHHHRAVRHQGVVQLREGAVQDRQAERVVMEHRDGGDRHIRSIGHTHALPPHHHSAEDVQREGNRHLAHRQPNSLRAVREHQQQPQY